MAKQPQLSIIIPAYNEANRIKPTLEKIQTYLETKLWTAELIVVDDGSKDNTSDIVKRLKKVTLIQQQNTGKGGAVRTGMQAARGNWRLFSDADLSTPINELDKFLAMKDQADVLIASRALRESKLVVKQSWPRQLIGKSFNKLVQLLLVPGIKDTQCGFKMFNARAADKVFSLQQETGFGFDVELLYIARKHGFSIMEIPVQWVNSVETKVTWKDPMRMFGQVLRIRLRAWRGAYR